MAQIRRALAMGFFDGVHIGHAALLRKAGLRASELGAVPSVLSFDVHPDNLIFNRETQLINDARGRKEIIRR
ncbi:MAG: riboflavin biosynthesis protein RibF, partial [Oscillospiraceae bacterium]|nr:riboflavin biosynthesis protein RibF [Oscillospiraceae bacterium]